MERTRGVLDCADEEVVQPLVVVERRGRERLAPLPAADDVDEGIDAVEALGDLGGPSLRLVRREEIDGLGVPALVRQA